MSISSAVFSQYQNSKNYEKIEQLIGVYSWDQSSLLNHSLISQEAYQNFLSFLYNSKLIFAIRGYEQSLQVGNSPMKEGIKLIRGEPHLLKEGEWVSWREVHDELTFDPKNGLIVSKTDSQVHWNYLYPKGLVPQSRYKWVGIVHKLSEGEQHSLYDQATQFDHSINIPISRCHYIQLTSSGKSSLDKFGAHVGIRLIRSDGSVYSIGFEIPTYKKSFSIHNIFATYNVAITSLDFTEFKPFDVKRVTTITISTEVFDRILAKVNKYAKSSLRLNFLNQNCSDFAVNILREANIELSCKNSSWFRIFAHFVPPVSSIPYLGPPIGKICTLASKVFKKFSKVVPKQVKRGVNLTYRVITFIPSRLATFSKNIFYLSLGANRNGDILESQNPGQEAFVNHIPPISTWKDLFRDISITLPIEIAKWQDKQHSTQILPYEGPKFYITQREPVKDS